MRYRTCYMRLGIALAATAMLATPAFAQNCLQDEYSKVQSQNLNCTANDVRVAQVVGIRDPATGQPLTTCIEGAHFNFLADFQIVTSSTSSRSNIGLYFATASTTQALTGTCVDNIISPAHGCPSNAAITCGSDNYHELDSAPDNCGDTSSSDSSPVFGTASEGVTIEVDNFLCEAPSGSTTLVLPNCTSWQVPGRTNLCTSSSPNFPYPAPPAAIPGSPSKCNCSIISLPITPVTPNILVQKACTTAQTPGPATFTQGMSPTQSPTSCNVGNGTTTESGIATYTLAITNLTGTSGITIDQICDTAYGTIFRSNSFTGPACAAGTNGSATFGSCTELDIPASGNGTTSECTFTAGPQPELTTVSDIATVDGHADINTAKTISKQSNSVSVMSTEVPSTATVTKGFVGTTAGCATVRYSVDVKNTSGADEGETLQALNDSAFGDITKCTNAGCANNSGANGSLQILGTTCGQTTNGIGTLATTAGAGALGALATGASYTCEFDAQFCSALDNNSCISNTDAVSATLVGDEATDQPFTHGGNSLTVKECFTASATSSGTP